MEPVLFTYEKLSGNPEKAVVYGYGTGISGLLDITEKKFSPEGLLLEQINREPDGTVSSRRVYRYDPAGRIEGAVLYNGDESVNTQEFFSYSREGRLLREQRVRDGKTNADIRYRYDRAGRLILIKTNMSETVHRYREYPDGTVAEITEEDSRGYWRHRIFRKDGSLESDEETMEYWPRTRRLFDRQERLVVEIFPGANGEAAGRKEYRYDERGRIAGEVTMDADGIVSETSECSYSYDGRVSTRRYSRTGEGLICCSHQEKDRQGNVVSESEIQGNGKLNHKSVTVYTYPDAV